MKKIMVGCVVMLAVAGIVFAGALTAARDTPSRDGGVIGATVKSNVIIYAGSLVAIDSTGKALPAADASGLQVVGRATHTVDNRTAVYSATASIQIERGIFRFANSNGITVATNYMGVVYASDDQTVSKATNSYSVVAGRVVDVDAAGVWVDTRLR